MLPAVFWGLLGLVVTVDAEVYIYTIANFRTDNMQSLQSAEWTFQIYLLDIPLANERRLVSGKLTS